MILLLYHILITIVSVFIIPNICIGIYLQSLTDLDEPSWAFLYYFIFDCLYRTIFCTFINIIALRVWLLYYDYKFAIATVDRIWRNVINPSDRNFFLNHRTTLGNSDFSFKLIFALWLFLVLICFVFVVEIFYVEASTVVVKHEFIALRMGMAGLLSVFIFIISHKVKKINDEFNIRKEMQYLSYLVYFIIATSIVDVSLWIHGDFDFFVFETITYTMDFFFMCCSCYIQTKWVLDLFVDHLKDNQQQLVRTQTSDQMSMVQVLRNKAAFRAFMVASII